MTAGRSVATGVVLGGLATWLTATVVSQHPLPTFDRVRALDPTGLIIPDWRFFAPEPARHDYHLLHRVLTPDDVRSPWRETITYPPRHWRQIIWFPHRRQEKALFDACSTLVTLLREPRADPTAFPVYVLLRDFTERVVRAEYQAGQLPQGFQFLLAQHTGHDSDHLPDYLYLSPFVPLGSPG